ncbi:type II toxin-antitoxin system RelE/ParE family toxin [Brevundimonas sp.]|uniref:type II toxin-antitoxin system RelE/ParE family toxin n=1 Tax=Brevundimonas sp. TaxID=1871086 RepID=UPI003D11DCE6
MTAINITAPARKDIDRLLALSLKSFGETASDRYRSLVLRGLITIRDDPKGPKVRTLNLARQDVLSLHLRSIQSQVRRPRHRLIYTVDNETVIVLRVLHDRMDLNAAFS